MTRSRPPHRPRPQEALPYRLRDMKGHANQEMIVGRTRHLHNQPCSINHMTFAVLRVASVFGHLVWNFVALHVKSQTQDGILRCASSMVIRCRDGRNLRTSRTQKPPWVGGSTAATAPSTIFVGRRCRCGSARSEFKEAQAPPPARGWQSWPE